MAQTIVFVDMDGVVARFYKDPGCLKHYHDEGFFINLDPYESMVDALKMLEQQPGISLYILSTAETEEIQDEKSRWLAAKDLNTKAFFPRTSEKAQFVIKEFGDFGDRFVLIDDYSRNLKEWQACGGTSIKALNELNGRGFNGHHFQGACVDITASKEQIVEKIQSILG